MFGEEVDVFIEGFRIFWLIRWVYIMIFVWRYFCWEFFILKIYFRSFRMMSELSFRACFVYLFGSFVFFRDSFFFYLGNIEWDLLDVVDLEI